MRDLPRPEVIFTHESDLDGLLSGMLLKRLAKKVFNADVRMEAFHYNFWKQRDLRERAAWAADFTFESRMDKPEWLVVDHHVTEASPKSAQLVHDLNKSAATLCYELCKEHGIQSAALDRIVHLNNVSDLFLVDDPDFVTATDYASLVKSYQFWNLHTLIDGNEEKLLDHPLLEVMAVRRRVENPLGFEWSKSNVTEVSPTLGFVDTVVGNNNIIVHQLLEQKATKYPALVTLFRRGSLVFASFRSHNGEALKIAEKFQGGGHANAAGALLPKSIRTVPDGVDYLRQILNPRNHARQSPFNSLESLFAEVEAEKKA
jgi:oligoribonuclease NrnB/cAMP/cGMP phosphodiesterase (DHH superfamily)